MNNETFWGCACCCFNYCTNSGSRSEADETDVRTAAALPSGPPDPLEPVTAIATLSPITLEGEVKPYSIDEISPVDVEEGGSLSYEKLNQQVKQKINVNKDYVQFTYKIDQADYYLIWNKYDSPCFIMFALQPTQADAGYKIHVSLEHPKEGSRINSLQEGLTAVMLLAAKHKISHYKVVRSDYLASFAKSNTQAGKEITIYVDGKKIDTNWSEFAFELEKELREKQVLSGGVPQGRNKPHQDGALLSERLVPGSYYLSFRTDRPGIFCPLGEVDFTQQANLPLVSENEGKREMSVLKKE